MRTSGRAVLLLVLYLHIEVHGEPEPDAAPAHGLSRHGPASSHQEALTKYLLSKLLGDTDTSPLASSQRRDSDSAAGFKFPLRHKDPLQKLLDHAKANIDVIDFRNPDRKYFADDHLRLPRQPEDLTRAEDSLYRAGARADLFEHSDPRTSSSSSSPSDAVPVFLPFPGNEKSYKRPTRQAVHQAPTFTINSGEPYTMPLQKLGGKEYYLGIFFKANWYKAEQYCRFHNMHLASINSEEEQRELEEHITGFGMGNEHFWSSGTDQGEESKFVWMATGKPLTYENWNAGEPNNFQYENGETENCLELWNRDGKGLRWNDTPCSFESYFVCEV